MALTGSVVTAGILVSPPLGGWDIRGEDGKHYYILNGGALCCAETNAILPDSVSFTQFRDKLLEEIPTCTDMIAHFPIPVRGTAYFGFIGGSFSGNIGLVFYKVNSDGEVEFVSASAYTAETFGLGAFGEIGFVGGACTDTVAGRVYFTLNSADGLCLSWAPYLVGEVDQGGDTWGLHCTGLPAEIVIGQGFRNYWGCHALRKRADPETIIELYQYMGLPEGRDPPTFYYCAIDYEVNSASAASNVASVFGIPFSDVGKDLDGNDGADDNDYTSPYIFGNEFIFARVCFEEFDTSRIHLCTLEGPPDTGTFTDGQVIDVPGYTITGIGIRLLNSAVVRDGDNLLCTIMDRGVIYFNQVNVPPEDQDLPADAVGGSGMQLEPRGCLLRAQPFSLTAEGFIRDLNSVVELGPFRFAEQKESDETSMVTTLILGLTECDIGLVVEIDMMDAFDEIDMVTLVDVLGDDIEVDMGEGVGNSDDFTLHLLGNDDGSTYPGAPIEFKPEELEPIEDRGSTKQYSPLGYSFIYHRVRLSALDIDDKFEVKFVDISGQLTGRLL